MPAKGSRSATLRVTSIRIVPDGAGTIIQVLQEAHVEGRISLEDALSRADVRETVQAPAIVTVTPPASPSVTQAPDSGTMLEDTGANGPDLPFDPERSPDTDADAKVYDRPDLGDVKKRIRKTQGKEE